MNNSLTELNSKELKVITLILNSGTVHYSDIEKSIGRSRKTITKYLNEIEHVTKNFDVDLVRKRNVGVYFDGDTTDLSNAVRNTGYPDTPKTREERVTLILSKLLMSDETQSIQKLADISFVSRGTLENDFKEVKKILAEHNAIIENTPDGIRVVASESAKRKLISELLTMYWGNTLYSKNEEGEVHSKLRLPKEITEFFSKHIFSNVLNALDKFENTSELKLTDYEYQSLAIHLIISLERITKDEVLTTSEYDVDLEPNTIRLIKIIEDIFKIKIPEYEQQYINIHILAAEGQLINENKLQGKVSDFRQQTISDFLESNLSEYDHSLISGLMVHLSSGLKRLYLGLSLHNPYTEEIKRNFPQAFNEAIDLCAKLEKAFNVSLNKDEVAYVALHIEAFFERKKNMVTAVIVCSTGLGTARLLNQRIKKFFADSIQVLRVTSIQDLKHKTIREDLVISTINFNVPNKPVVIVPPFLDSNSVERIKDTVAKILHDNKESLNFINLLNKDLIFINHKKEQRDQVISKIGRTVLDMKYGKEGIIQAAIKREGMASTAMDNIAMPHAPVDFVEKPFIAVYINKDGIDWNGSEVNIVFFLAMNQEVHDQIDDIYKYFNDVLENKVLLKRVINSKDNKEIFKLLSGGEAIG